MVVASSSERLVLEFSAKDNVTGPLKAMVQKTVAGLEAFEAPAKAAAAAAGKAWGDSFERAMSSGVARGVSRSVEALGDITTEAERQAKLLADVKFRIPLIAVAEGSTSSAPTQRAIRDLEAVESRRARLFQDISRFSSLPLDTTRGRRDADEAVRQIDQVAHARERVFADLARFSTPVDSARARRDAEQSKRLLTDQAAQAHALAGATRTVAQGFQGVGFAATSALGPAGVAIRDVAGEVLALGGGLDALIGKLGIGRGALLGLGVGAAVIGAGTAGLAAASKAAFDVEKGLQGAVVAGARLGVTFEEIERVAVSVSNRTGIAVEEVGAALKLAFEGGARSADDAANQVEVAARAFQDANLGGSLVEGFEALKSSAEGFGKSGRDFLPLLLLIKAGADEAGTGTRQFASAITESAVAVRALGGTERDIAKLVLSAAKAGVPIESAGRGVAAIVKLLSNPDSTGFKVVQRAGHDMSAAAIEARGLVESVRLIRDEFGTAPQDLSRLFGARDLKDVQATLAGISEESFARFDAMAQSIESLDAAKLERTKLASTELADSWNRLTNSATSLGSGPLAVLAAGLRAVELNLLPLQGLWAAVFDDTAQEKALKSSDAMTRVTAQIYAQEEALASLMKRQEAIEARKSNPVTRAFDESSPVAAQAAASVAIDIEAARAKLDELRAERVSIPGVVKIDPVALEAATPKRITVEVELAQQSIVDSLAALQGKTPPLKIQAAVEYLLDIQSDPLAVNFGIQSGEIDKAIAGIDAYEAAVTQADAVLASLQDRALTGAARQRAEAERLIAQTEKLIATLRKQGVEERVLAQITAEIPGVREDTEKKIAKDKTRETVDANARLLGLKIQLIDRERSLAAAVGVTADSDAEAARALSERAKLQRDLVLAQIAGQRAAIDPTNTDALAALKEQEDLLLRIVDAETAAAAAAFDRARIDRSARTTDLVTDAGDDLRAGLDREFAAIERNRQAKIKSAEDGVRAGTLEADALARLLPIYDAIAQRDQERALRAASQRDAEDIANLVRDASGAYADQASALQLIREVERDRYAEALAAEGLLQDEIEKRLALFDRITEKQKSAQAIQFARTPAVQLALDGLDDDAFAAAQAATDKIVQGLIDAKAPAEEIGRAIEEGMQRAVDAIGDARTGMTALVEGWKAGWKDFLREVNDDAAFGANAAGQLGGGFRDSLSSAFQGKSNEGESVGQTFLRSNLENIQKQAADFAANKVSAGLFGALGLGGENQVGTPEEQLSLAATTFSDAVNRFAAASDPAANFALGTNPAGLSIPTAQGYDPAGNAIGGFVGPQLPSGDVLDSPYTALPEGLDFTQAGEEFSATIGTGADRAAQAIVSGGDVFGAGLQGLIGGIGNALSGILNSVVGGISGSFAEGGIVQGSLKPYTPHRAQYGRVVRQRTLIEVAENPGLEEAIIPLRGGAVPVQISRKEAPNRERDYDREATMELVQSMRGRAVAQEREARADRSRGSNAPNITVQGSTVTLQMTFQGGASGDRGEDLLRAMPEIEKRLTSAIEQGTNRRLINAVRGAVA